MLSLALFFAWIVSGIAGFCTALCIFKDRGNRAFFVMLVLAVLGGPFGFFLSLSLLRALQSNRVDTVPFEVFESEVVSIGAFHGRRLGEGGASSPRPDAAFYLSRNVTPLSFTRLRHFVFSQEDEVRLIAFSTLHRMESSLNLEIDRLLHKLKNTQGENRILILESLAELYSELVFLGLVDKELEDFYLCTAEQYARKALELRESGKCYYLLGRILLRRKKAEEAEQCFALAMQRGFLKERIIPYLLECAYIQGDLKKIVTVAKSTGDLCLVDHRAWNIIAFWAGKEKDCGCSR